MNTEDLLVHVLLNFWTKPSRLFLIKQSPGNHKILKLLRFRDLNEWHIFLISRLYHNFYLAPLPISPSASSLLSGGQYPLRRGLARRSKQAKHPAAVLVRLYGLLVSASSLCFSIISTLSMAMRGLMTGLVTDASVTTSASAVWLATCPRFSPRDEHHAVPLLGYLSAIFIMNLRTRIVVPSSGQFITICSPYRQQVYHMCILNRPRNKRPNSPPALLPSAEPPGWCTDKNGSELPNEHTSLGHHPCGHRAVYASRKASPITPCR